MFLFEGNNCPYCDQPFAEKDDLAVCPECGTPHHRACYKEHGHCANEAKHAEGFEWKDTARPVSHATRTCPRCRRETDAAGHFCSYCGYAFTQPAAQNSAPQAAPLGLPFGPAAQQPLPDSLLFRAADGSTERLSLDDTIFDIPARDWVTYVGTSVGYYLFHIRRQEQTGRKTGFTLSAMLFPSVYFLYRRMWKYAAISFLLNFLLSIPAVLITVAELMEFSLGAFAPTLKLLSRICPAITIVLCALWGLFAVYLYRKQALKTFAVLRAQSASEEDYRLRLRRVSGPSVLAVNIVFIALFLLSFFVTPLLAL